MGYRLLSPTVAVAPPSPPLHNMKVIPAMWGWDYHSCQLALSHLICTQTASDIAHVSLRALYCEFYLFVLYLNSNIFVLMWASCCMHMYAHKSTETVCKWGTSSNMSVCHIVNVFVCISVWSSPHCVCLDLFFKLCLYYFCYNQLVWFSVVYRILSCCV